MCERDREKMFEDNVRWQYESIWSHILSPTHSEQTHTHNSTEGVLPFTFSLFSFRTFDGHHLLVYYHDGTQSSHTLSRLRAVEKHYKNDPSVAIVAMNCIDLEADSENLDRFCRDLEIVFPSLMWYPKDTHERFTVYPISLEAKDLIQIFDQAILDHGRWEKTNLVVPLNSSTFWDAIVTPEKHVVVELYYHHKEMARTFHAHYERLAVMYRTNSDLLFTKLDGLVYDEVWSCACMCVCVCVCVCACACACAFVLSV